MVVGNLHFLPIGTFIWLIGTILTCYIIAVLKKDVEPIFPYVSDTVTFSPTSSIFAVLIYFGTILLAIVMYIRFLQIKHIHIEGNKVSRMNIVSLIVGLLVILGYIFAGNFPETEVLAVHNIGALTILGGGILYQLLQWYISRKTMKECRIKLYLVNIRLLLTMITIIAIALCYLFSHLAKEKFFGEDMAKWKQTDGGYKLHIISAISEWICLLANYGFVLSFYEDFKHFHLNEPSILPLP